MSASQITTKTSEQIDAAFEAVFKDIQPPAAAVPVTLENRLEPYRKAIRNQRRRGLTWEQIAQGMGDPKIDETVSARTLRRIFGGKEKAGKRARKPAAPKPKKVKPPKPRLIRDPKTGKLTIIPPPSVTAEAPKSMAPEPAPSGSLFDRLAPKIIRMGYAGDVAESEFVEGFVAENPGSDVDVSNAFVEASMAQLDTLSFETAQKKYGVKQDDWENWRPEWCKLRDLPTETS